MINFINFSKWWIGLLSIIVFQIPLLAQSGINGIGSFEQDLPSYWTKGAEPSGATLSWATDEFRSMGKSLKIEKGTTSEAAMWESENMVDLWSDRHFANVDIKFGMYYMTSGVNVDPANDDEKWYVTFSFYREDATLIGETKFELDQSVPSTAGWVADTTDIGDVILTEDSYTTIIRFVGGKDATGTVWTDDYEFNGRDGWAGQDWNTSVGVPTGWFYWLPPVGGNDGILSDGYENTIVTDEDAYDGTYSLKFDLPGTHDGFVGTRKFELDVAQPGNWLGIHVRIKAMNLEPDSAIAVGDAWSIAITPIFHTTLDNNDGWGEYKAYDLYLTFPNATEFDWTQFQVNVKIPEPPAGEVAKSISVRLHPLGRWQGTAYLDLLEISVAPTGIEDEFLPVTHNLFQNYPNPFNPSTTIKYDIPQQSRVVIKVYDMMGKEIKTLVNEDKSPGYYSAQWNGENSYGKRVTTGIYFYRVVAGNFTQVKKMILLK
jgi:hypothetical protein